MLAIDLFCGLGGWTEGFLAEGWQVIGFDIERHVYGEARYPAQLVIQDVLTLHGSQFRNADCIVASPPCQEFSYMAMPWKRGKQIAAALRGEKGAKFPWCYEGSRTIPDLTRLFDACFRIQREAIESAGRRIPMVVENVKGAQPWVGRAKANFGSYYLWGDIAQVGRRIVSTRPAFGEGVRALKASKNGGGGSWFPIAHGVDSGEMYGKIPVRGEGVDGRKGPGGDWFADGRQGQDACAEALGLKVPGFNFHQHENGGAGGSFQSAAVAAGRKHGGDCFNDPSWPGKAGGVKRNASDTLGWSKETELRNNNSKSPARKAASAQIAKIPLPLSRFIARIMKPQLLRETAEA